MGGFSPAKIFKPKPSCVDVETSTFADIYKNFKISSSPFMWNILLFKLKS